MPNTLPALPAFTALAALAALFPGVAGAQTTQAPDSCASRGAAPPLMLTYPFLARGDTVELLRGEILANGVAGQGAFTIEYLSRAAAADTVAQHREAAALAGAVTPAVDGVAVAAVTVRACQAEVGRDGMVAVSSFTFPVRPASGAAAPDSAERPAPSAPPPPTR